MKSETKKTKEKLIRNKEILEAPICCNKPMELKAYSDARAWIVYFQCKRCGGYIAE